MQLEAKDKEVFEGMMQRFSEFKRANKTYLKDYSEAKVMFLFLIKARIV